MFISAAFSVVTLALAGLFLFEVRAQSLPRQHSVDATGSVSSGTVYLSASGQEAAEAAAVEVISTKKTPMREVHIANTGFMLLRGATVISNSGNTVRVSMAWGPSNFTWTLETNNNTRILNSKGEKGILKDIEVGDFVTVTGILTKSGVEPTIDTEFLREQETS